MQTYLNQRKVLFKKTTNMIYGPIVNQHERIIFIIISKQIKSLSTFSIKYKYFKLNHNSDFITIMTPQKGVGITPASMTLHLPV